MDISREETSEKAIPKKETTQTPTAVSAYQSEQQLAESLTCEDENTCDDKESSSAKDNENAPSDQASDKEDADEDSQPLAVEENQEDLAEVEEETNRLLSDINYGTVLSYFDKFSVHLALRDLNVFKNFESSITNKKNRMKYFNVDFSLILLAS